MAGNSASFKQKTVQNILQKNFQDEKTKVNSDAVVLATEVLRVFVAEAASRAAVQAQKDGTNQVTIDYFEKILPQLHMDEEHSKESRQSREKWDRKDEDKDRRKMKIARGGLRNLEPLKFGQASIL